MGKAKVTLVKDMQFVGTSDSGHALVMDGTESVGGSNTGPRPMELLFMAFGGCSGMDPKAGLREESLRQGG